MKATFKSLLKKGDRFIGTYVSFPADDMLEVMKLAGMDFIILDMEHDQLTLREVMSMIRTCDACGLASMVRVPGLNETMIRKVLDMGASAVKVPDIHNAEEARQAVDYAKYPPMGVRGACPYVRGNGYGTDKIHCYEQANQETAVSVIIEGLDGIAHMEEIIATPGIDSVSVGNIDLAVALGVPGQTFHPKVIEAVKECARLCEKYGKTCSAQVRTAEDAREFDGYLGISHFHVEFPPYVLYKGYKALCDGLKQE